MGNVVRLQSAPRTATTEGETPDVLVPALARLRACGSDPIDVLRLADELPDMVLPCLTWAASRRRDIPPTAVRVLIKCCGDLFLERCLGRKRLRQLKARYPVSEAFQTF